MVPNILKYGVNLRQGAVSLNPYCINANLVTKWEKLAENRLFNHDMYPEKIDNR